MLATLQVHTGQGPESRTWAGGRGRGCEEYRQGRALCRVEPHPAPIYTLPTYPKLYYTSLHLAFPTNLLPHPQVVDGHVECAYHGWQFNADGACTKMPSTPHCRNVGVAALPCAEKDGFVWVWPGEGLPPQVSMGARWERKEGQKKGMGCGHVRACRSYSAWACIGTERQGCQEGKAVAGSVELRVGVAWEGPAAASGDGEGRCGAWARQG